jgi:hypothetical protein
VVLESDSRKPSSKHEILEMYVQHELALPDTPTIALHRGRIDLLETHLGRDAGLLRLAALQLDYDELEIARWLLKRGMDVNARAAVDADGFGGHTALFGSVVSYPTWWKN